MSKISTSITAELVTLDPLGRDPVRRKQVVKIVIPSMLAAFLAFMFLVASLFTFCEWMLEVRMGTDGDPTKALFLPLAFLLTLIPTGIIASAVQAIGLALGAKTTPTILDTEFKDFFGSKLGIFKGEKDYGNKDDGTDDAMAAFLLVQILVVITLSITAYQWSLPAGELIITVGVTVGISLVLLLLGFVAVLLLSDYATTFGNFIFARFIFGSAGLLSAQVLSRSSSSLPGWVRRWLDKSDWHEETARALLPEFEGSLLELVTISRALGPDAQI